MCVELPLEEIQTRAGVFLMRRAQGKSNHVGSECNCVALILVGAGRREILENNLIFG